MEASGVAVRQRIPSFSVHGTGTRFSEPKSSSASSSSLDSGHHRSSLNFSFSGSRRPNQLPRLRYKNRIPFSFGPTVSLFGRSRSGDCGFSDYGYTQFYQLSLPRCRTVCESFNAGKGCVGVMGKTKGKAKKKLKLLKGLTKDLSVFSELGWDLDPAKSKTLSEAVEVLAGQLQRLREEEKEAKRRRHDKARMKVKPPSLGNWEADSSSSSESSDSEWEGGITSSSARLSSLPSTEFLKPAGATGTVGGNHEIGSAGGLKRVEVCMGKKCGNAGAGALLGELSRRMGDGAEVVGCKCMGKCRDAPNVRVLRSGTETVCKGVGMEDVKGMVSQLSGGDWSVCRLAPP